MNNEVIDLITISKKPPTKAKKIEYACFDDPSDYVSMTFNFNQESKTLEISAAKCYVNSRGQKLFSIELTGEETKHLGETLSKFYRSI